MLNEAVRQLQSAINAHSHRPNPYTLVSENEQFSVKDFYSYFQITDFQLLKFIGISIESILGMAQKNGHQQFYGQENRKEDMDAVADWTHRRSGFGAGLGQHLICSPYYCRG